jgi:mannosyl-3-phosphoglycerate phosphatase
MQVSFIIFTDLDASLLDHQTYSFQEALPVLKRLKKKKIPVVLCTSKTRAETEVISRSLGLKHPFIVENGGAIFIPKDYFGTEHFRKAGVRALKKKGYYLIQLGLPYRRLRQIFKLIKENTAARMTGFGDLTPEKIAEITGLKLKEARLAGKREYDEPFFLENARDYRLIKKQVRLFGVKVVRGGRFYHLTGDNDKGKAVGILKKLYRIKFGKILTIGLGDSANDWPMLKAVDLPVLIARPDGQKLKVSGARKKVLKTRKPGPAGWAEAVGYFLSLSNSEPEKKGSAKKSEM